jgi:hypothetical protein
MSREVDEVEATRWETPPLMKEEGVKAAAEPTMREAMASFMLMER